MPVVIMPGTRDSGKATAHWLLMLDRRRRLGGDSPGRIGMMATQLPSPGRLFGPVLFYELVRLARRSRYFLLRCFYALAILLLLMFMYANYAFPAGQIGGQEMSKFGESFFQIFMASQFLAALLLTPIYTAGAIAEEKERKTLDFLLATDLSSRELTLSKLAARVANLGFLFLTGLPILGFIQFWGGIDPNLVLAGFTTAGLTVISLGAFSLLNSIYARRSRDAIVLTYLAVTAYLGLSLLSQSLTISVPTPWFDLVDAFNAGNILVVLAKLGVALRAGHSLAAVVPRLLRNYALFHGLLAVVCLTWAVWRFRAVALAQAGSSPRRATRPAFRLRWRPGNQPMVWKEICAEPGLSFNWVGCILIALIILVSFIPALWIIGDFLIETSAQDRYRYPGALVWGSASGRLAISLNSWAKVVGPLVACLTLLAVSVRAAGSVTGERDRQTLDGLLTTPLTGRAIIFAKWLGSLWGVRWAVLWLFLIWWLGALGGGLNLYMVPWLLLSWVIYAVFMSSLGLLFSLVCSTTLKATIWTIIATAVLSFGHWLPWLVFGLPTMGWWREDLLKQLFNLQIYGLTPPVAINWLSFRAYNFEFISATWEDPWVIFVAIMQGLLFWLVAAIVLARLACWRFQALTAAPQRHSTRHTRPATEGPPPPGLSWHDPWAMDQA